MTTSTFSFFGVYFDLQYLGVAEEWLIMLC